MKTKIKTILSPDSRVIKFLVPLYLFFIAFFICMQSPLNPLKVELASVDSSVFHYVASVMKNGGLFYRDTFDHKGPLLYFINYLGLYISYYSGAWFIELLFIFLTIILQYLTARLFCNRLVSCCCIFLTCISLTICFFGGNFPECYALLFISLSLYIFTDYFFNQKVTGFRLILCGASSVCAFMLKPNTIAVWLVFCAAIFLIQLIKKEYKCLFTYIILFLSGMLISLLPFLFYLCTNGILSDFWNTYILFNLEYSQDAGIKASLINCIKTATRELVVPCFLIGIFNLYKRERREFWFTYLVYLLVSVLLCSMSGNEYIYYRISLVPAYVIPLAAFGAQIKFEKKNLLTVEILFVVFCSIISQQMLFPAKNVLSKIINHSSEVDLGDEHHRELFSLIETYTEKDEPITVYGNENAFYFYSQRFSASKYSFTYPIVLINENIRNEYFQELHETLPKLILVQTLWCNDEYIQEFLSTHPYECITDYDDYGLYLLTTETN